VFRAIAEGAADALLVPVENSLAGSVVRVLTCSWKTLDHHGGNHPAIELHLIAGQAATIADIRTVSSHPMALAQCERFFPPIELQACSR